MADSGAAAEGTAYIWRPGRMRFDYDPPEPTLIIAWEGQVMHYDRDLRTPSIVPASQTPSACCCGRASPSRATLR